MDDVFRPLDWVHTTNIYEVNVRQFTPEGTFNAFVKELPRLKDMGIEVLWFMPVTPIAEEKKKGLMGSYYACSDYISINPEFGTIDDFRMLVKNAHSQGFKVIIDWVANHTGWDHIWTREHPEYYQKDSITGTFKVASGMDDIIELDFKNPDLVKAKIDAMRFWIDECDIDGFRCDLGFWVELPFWKKARKELDAVKPLFWFGELDELKFPEYSQAFDVTYSWTWMHHTRHFYQEHLPISTLDAILKQYESLGNHSMRAWFTTNHDENSWNGTEYEKYGDMALPLAVFSCTWNGIPLIYSGQELPNKKRLEFFDKDIILWTGKFELHDFYKTLLNLRKNPALRAGDDNAQTFRLKTTADEQIFSYLRKNGDNEVLVLLNFSPVAKLQFDISDPVLTGRFRNVFGGGEKDLTTEKSFEIGAWEYLVYEK
jgi:alpha-amylase